jgi:hypothetical protein
MTGEYLDLTNDPQGHGQTSGDGRSGRRFVGVHFLCCDVYARVYVNRQQTAYEGHCPRCAKPVRLRIGPEGTDARFFIAQ